MTGHRLSRVAFAVATVALTSACSTSLSEPATASAAEKRCFREFGPAGKVPAVVVSCPRKGR